MSRLAKKPLKILPNVTIEINNNNLSIKGPKGELKTEIHPFVLIEKDENNCLIFKLSDKVNKKDKTAKSILGTTVRNICNMMQGVTQGFQKALELVGVGFKVQLEGKDLKMSLGFSHPVVFKGVKGIEFVIDEKMKNIFYVKGIDKQLVGQVAANIRALKAPEPYKGKGIRYVGEHIIRKSTKSLGKK